MPTRRDCLRLTSAAALAPAAAAPAPFDSRYAPLQYRTAYCFPDNPHKSLVDERGRLLYGNPGRTARDFFPHIVEFGLQGMGVEHGPAIA